MSLYEGAGRYSLILETDDNKKYYFDSSLGNFVLLYEDEKPVKSTLQALDFLTSNFHDKYALKDSYDIPGNLSKIYITYQFKGEKKLACIFNNRTWQHIALTYTGKEIDYRDRENLKAFNDVYEEIQDIGSNFANELLKNNNKLVNLSPNTINTILGLRAHKCATIAKQTYGFGPTDYETYDAVSRVYSEDAYGFYQDLKKQLSRYREFRTVYMNYCKFKGSPEKAPSMATNVKKKVIVPPHQISMFDQPWE